MRCPPIGRPRSGAFPEYIRGRAKFYRSLASHGTGGAQTLHGLCRMTSRDISRRQGFERRPIRLHRSFLLNQGLSQPCCHLCCLHIAADIGIDQLIAGPARLGRPREMNPLLQRRRQLPEAAFFSGSTSLKNRFTQPGNFPLQRASCDASSIGTVNHAAFQSDSRTSMEKLR
ncbi:hypothetical protein BDW22DRAFT_943723 [Trametopsis cervina]|nr:hypothetical protein BDW22DRAFT_943723 [Trametopsis cervina]